MLPSVIVTSRKRKLVQNHHWRWFAQNWFDPDLMVNVDATEPVQTGLNASVRTGLRKQKRGKSPVKVGRWDTLAKVGQLACMALCDNTGRNDSTMMM